AELVLGLVGVGKVAREQLEDDLVDRVQEVDRATRERLADERDSDAVLALADAGRKHRPRRLEGRVLIAEIEELIQHGDEPTEMRIPPFAAGALALLDDRIDRTMSTCEIGDGRQLGEAKVLRRRLCARRS